MTGTCAIAARCCLVSVSMCAAANGLRASDATKPLQTELEDQVRVQMKLIDAIVVDEQGRTVPALSRDDFDLTLDGAPARIDSFDAQCASEPIADVRPVRNVGKRAPVAPDVSRKIVVVVDYPHLLTEDRRFVLEDLERVIRFAKASREEVMIVALVGRVRLEQRFSADGEEVLSSLRRMDHDVSLWLPDYAWTTQSDFFRSLVAVLDSLSFEPGPKAVVLYSKIEGSPESSQDRLREVAASAQDAHATIYPVYVPGIRGDCLNGCPLLARLASDTGGRLYYKTLDLTVGYARAQRDSGCRYTFGFYTGEPEGTRVERFEIIPRRAGLKVIYPGAAVTRSPRVQRRSWLDSAFYFPAGFGSPQVAGHIDLIRPKTNHTWEATLAVAFPAPRAGSGSEASTIDFGGALSKRNGPAHAFARRLTIRPKSSARPSARQITFLQSLELQPGTYTLTLVIDGPLEDRPLSATQEIEVPRVPTGSAFLLTPQFERRAGTDLVLRGDAVDATRDRIGSGETLEPLVFAELAETQTLIARTLACRRSGRWSRATTIDRRLRDSEGTLVRAFDGVPFRGATARELSCQEVSDTLQGSELESREYAFEAAFAGRPTDEGRSAQSRFTVIRAVPRPPPSSPIP